MSARIPDLLDMAVTLDTLATTSHAVTQRYADALEGIDQLLDVVLHGAELTPEQLEAWRAVEAVIPDRRVSVADMVSKGERTATAARSLRSKLEGKAE